MTQTEIAAHIYGRTVSKVLANNISNMNASNYHDFDTLAADAFNAAKAFQRESKKHNETISEHDGNVNKLHLGNDNSIDEEETALD